MSQREEEDHQRHMEFDGEVVESIRGTVRVAIDLGGNESVIKCHVGGKMKKHKINVLVGDFVRVRVSPYDLTRGIIFHRHKKKPHGTST